MVMRTTMREREREIMMARSSSRISLERSINIKKTAKNDFGLELKI